MIRAHLPGHHIPSWVAWSVMPNPLRVIPVASPFALFVTQNEAEALRIIRAIDGYSRNQYAARFVANSPHWRYMPGLVPLDLQPRTFK